MFHKEVPIMVPPKKVVSDVDDEEQELSDEELDHFLGKLQAEKARLQ